MKPICFDCMWLFQPTDAWPEEDRNRMTCMAFYPNNIPDDIKDGKFAHHTRHPEQPNDLVFAYAADYKKPG